MSQIRRPPALIPGAKKTGKALRNLDSHPSGGRIWLESRSGNSKRAFGKSAVAATAREVAIVVGRPTSCTSEVKGNHRAAASAQCASGAAQTRPALHGASLQARRRVASCLPNELHVGAGRYILARLTAVWEWGCMRMHSFRFAGLGSLYSHGCITILNIVYSWTRVRTARPAAPLHLSMIQCCCSGKR